MPIPATYIAFLHSSSFPVPAFSIRNICRPISTALFCLLFFLGGGTIDVIAQTATIQGIVTDNENGQSLVGANVVLADPNDPSDLQGINTDNNGFYRLDGIDPGRYSLRISYIGYVAYTDTLQLEPGENITISVTLEPDAAIMDEIVVSGTGGAARLEGGLQQISPADISRVPTPAGGGDLASYLQALPGVVTAGDRGGGLFIRGGTPTENQVMMDGTLIYQPFHIVSFFSAFPEEIVSSVDFYAGGYGSRFNSRISSVLDINMRNGNRYETRGSASVSPFLAQVVAEGPLKSGTTSWIASVRRSLIEETSGAILPDQYPLRFESQFAKINYAGENDTRCSAHFMRTYDRGKIDLNRDESFQWGNLIFGGRCVMLPEDNSVLFDTNIGVSHVYNSVQSGFASERYSDATRLHIDLNVTQFKGNIRFNYGFFTHLIWLNYNTSDLFQQQQEDDPLMLGSGGYIDATFSLGDRIQLTTGTAFSIYRYYYPFNFEPRLRMSWQPTGSDDEEVTASVGIYKQPIAGIGDMRDAGAAFTAWVPAPIGESQMEALHMILGWNKSLGSGFNFSIEGYHKRLKNLAIPVWSTLATFTSELALAKGKVFGGDVRLEYDRGSFYGFIGYGYSWTEYESEQDHFNLWFGEPVQRFHPPHDRRHQINSMASITLGEFVVNLRGQFGSGLPYTRPFGYDELFYYSEYLPDVNTDFGTPRVILERPYQGRLPAYHRLDVSLERRSSFGASELSVQLGAVNAYNQTNIFYYDVFNHRRIDQLPFAPYVSLKLEMQ